MNNGVKTGVELIAEERQRQIEKEGWTPEHDNEHLSGDLTSAGMAYARYAWWQIFRDASGNKTGWTKEMLLDQILENEWPWDERWWKPADDPTRNLEKAGALIAAEIDREKHQQSASLSGQEASQGQQKGGK